MNKDLIILLQNSMAHATNIAIANKKPNEDILVADVIKTAQLIAAELAETATPEPKLTSFRKPGESR